MDSHECVKVLNELHEGVYLVDRQRRITYWNRAAEEITGYNADEVVGTTCADNLLVHSDKSGSELCSRQCPLAATMEDGAIRQAEVFLHHKSGNRLPVLVKTMPMTDKDGVIVGGMEFFTRIHLPAAALWEPLSLEQVDFVDSLTRLPNRRYLETELEMQFLLHQENNFVFGILLFNVDGMTGLNMQFGASTGNRILCAVAKTLAEGIRPLDTMGRWNGDVFMGIFAVNNARALRDKGQQLQLLANSVFVMINGERVGTTVSCGGTLVLLRDNLSDLVGRAEESLRQCKERGGNCCIVEVEDDLLK